MSDYRFAVEQSRLSDLALHMVEAAVAWQRAEAALAVANALWYTAKTSGADDEHRLYEDYRQHEAVRDGCLAQMVDAD